MGVLGDDTDPMVSVMKLEKAPQETYADIGGLDTQIQEIKVSCGFESKYSICCSVLICIIYFYIFILLLIIDCV